MASLDEGWAYWEVVLLALQGVVQAPPPQQVHHLPLLQWLSANNQGVMKSTSKMINNTRGAHREHFSANCQCLTACRLLTTPLADAYTAVAKGGNN